VLNEIEEEILFSAVDPQFVPFILSGTTLNQASVILNSP
jgi:hypothetical protein